MEEEVLLRKRGSLFLYNGVYPFICERVNRYTVNFGNMFTLPVTYGEMFLDRKGLWWMLSNRQS